MQLILQNRIRLQRILALMMILLCTSIFSWVTQTLFYPAVIAIVALIGSTGRYKIKIRLSRKIILLLFVALLYALYYRLLYARAGFTGATSQLRLQTQVGTQYYLLVMAALLFFSGRNTPSVWIIICGMITILTSGQLLYDANANFLFQTLALIYLALTILFSMLCRTGSTNSSPIKSRRIPLGRISLATSCLSITLALGWYSGEMLNQYHGRIVSLVFKLNFRPFQQHSQQAQAIGFSQNSQLNNMSRLKMTNANQVAFRVFSPQSPGYLRNLAFEAYVDGQWQSSSTPADISPSPDQLAAITQTPEKGNLFVWSNPLPPSLTEMDIWPAPHVNSGMFTPLNTVAARCDVDTLTVDNNNIIDSDSLRTGVDYIVAESALPPSQPELSPAQRSSCLTIPSTISSSGPIASLARNIFKNDQNTDQKINSVIEYFRRNYDYYLGIEIPPGQDPLNYFLLEKPPAHCEFFASGATILLRLAGVPTRYVTGVVADEFNSMGNYWIARNKDAHAWCEAWNDSLKRWVLVEATPASGIPQHAKTGFFSAFWQNLKFKFQQLSLAYIKGGLRGMAIWIIQHIGLLMVWLGTSLPGWILIILIALIFTRKHIAIWRARSAPAIPDKRLNALHQLLNQMDSHLINRAQPRPAGQTLHRYARNLLNLQPHDPFLQQAALWYQQYALVRYQTNLNDQAIEQLKNTMPSPRHRT